MSTLLMIVYVRASNWWLLADSHTQWIFLQVYTIV